MLQNASRDDDEDSYDGNLEEDPAYIDDVDKARLRIRQLTHEKQRSVDYENRLARKLQKLDADLATRREEVEGLRRSLQLERNKLEEEYLSGKRERDQKAATQEERIRDHLTDVLYTKPKQQAGAKGNASSDLDTVLVSYVKPNETYRYNLAFRIDPGTTTKELRASACKYWGANQDNFILRTMANNKCQDDNKVKDCFKQGEIAQLRLDMKRESAEPPTEEELKAIQPKRKKRVGKGAKPRFNTEGVDSIQKFGDNFSKQLQKMGGIYFLLKLRDTKPSEHATKIKLRDVIIYTALAVLSLYAYAERRRDGEAFWCSKGIDDFVTGPPIGAAIPVCSGVRPYSSLCVPSFNDMKEPSEVATWLNYAIPAIFWPTDPTQISLATYNRLLGYFTMRVKNVKTPTSRTEFCTSNSKDLVAELGGRGNLSNATCFPRSASGNGMRKDPYPVLVEYWRNVTNESTMPSTTLSTTTTLRFRGTMNPGEFISAEKNYKDRHVSVERGNEDLYDGSGYMVDYRMTVPDPTNATLQYRRDLAMFMQEGWYSVSTTRVVLISFSTYNYHYDMWTATELMIECPPGGDVLLNHYTQPFRPRIFETHDELTWTYVDGARLTISIYIFMFVGYMERQHKVRNHKAGAYYHISLTGITDIGIVTCMLIQVFWYIFSFQKDATFKYLVSANAAETNRFQSFSLAAFNYNTIFVVDGLMMVFLMYRMISFFRLSHNVYLLWHALGVALKGLGFFILVASPGALAFVLLSWSRFGGYFIDFSNFTRAFVTCVRFIQADVDPMYYETDPLWILFTMIAVYLIVTFLVLNLFTLILTDAHYVVQLTCAQPVEKWDLQRLRSWVFPRLCVNIFQAIWSSDQSEGRD
eukprot:TRINITY_DN41993_c0_g1_i1.p1 TRINITY_DN41993_c0_g1~~TRINITY_DN41993_c0_g1_i1.p1  ORF type:complete len:905 (+),score=115.20 TRINITY_DN41993_c0_g1_i1:117-2717(+)